MTEERRLPENKMGTMPVTKLLLNMALPIMLSMLVQALYNIVDSIFVAKIDEYALTAISLAFPIQSLMIAVGIGTAVGMSAFAEQISLLLYGTSKAAVAIMHSGPSIWLLGLQQITTGILQGIDKSNVPMFNMFIGIIVKLIAVWFLTDAAFNIAGAAWATNINFAVIAILNILVLLRYGISFKWLEIGKIILASGLMAVVGKLSYGILASMFPSVIANIAVLLVAAIAYVLLVPCLGIITKDEMKKLPLIKRFVK